MTRLSHKAIVGGIALAAVLAVAASRAEEPQDPDDPIARLDRQLQKGETTLQYRPGWGYLESVLEHLDVKVDSQILVFSKTSFQAERIGPKNRGRFTSTMTRRLDMCRAARCWSSSGWIPASASTSIRSM